MVDNRAVAAFVTHEQCTRVRPHSEHTWQKQKDSVIVMCPGFDPEERPCNNPRPHETHVWGRYDQLRCLGVEPLELSPVVDERRDAERFLLRPIELLEDGHHYDLSIFPRGEDADWMPANSKATEDCVTVECPMCFALVREVKLEPHIAQAHVTRP